LAFERFFFDSRRRSFAAFVGRVLVLFFGRWQCLFHQCQQPGARGLAVLTLRAMFARVDEQNAIARRAPSRQRDQTRLHVFWQQPTRSDRRAVRPPVATLLTFWPPGPDPRTNRSSITSLSSNEGGEIMTVLCL
jgi:hypothetical protein